MAKSIATGQESDTGGVRRTPSHQHLRRPSVNLSGAERAGRILLGGLGVAVGVVLLASASAAWVIVLEVLLVLAGLDLVVTGALGHCPLYQKLGHVPKSLRRPT